MNEAKVAEDRIKKKINTIFDKLIALLEDIKLDMETETETSVRKRRISMLENAIEGLRETHACVLSLAVEDIHDYYNRGEE